CSSNTAVGGFGGFGFPLSGIGFANGKNSVERVASFQPPVASFGRMTPVPRLPNALTTGKIV
ncbi:hypothetical protein, partial [Candidatus Binatus sp.]|uniref:hypothetical protein n=1 Tax=Candidatus Binatus sp. TaxID=2811406 RepID=UPI003CC6B34D